MSSQIYCRTPAKSNPRLGWLCYHPRTMHSWGVAQEVTSDWFIVLDSTFAYLHRMIFTNKCWSIPYQRFSWEGRGLLFGVWLHFDPTRKHMTNPPHFPNWRWLWCSCLLLLSKKIWWWRKYESLRKCISPFEIFVLSKNWIYGKGVVRHNILKQSICFWCNSFFIRPFPI